MVGVAFKWTVTLMLVLTLGRLIDVAVIVAVPVMPDA
jgi:hypothetical protein